MKAAVLNAPGQPLVIEERPDPVLGTGEVIVDVAAAGVASYTAGVLNGARDYLLELPVVPGPGGIGRVRATGPDATRLKPGDWVFVDSTIRSRDDAVNPRETLVVNGATGGFGSAGVAAALGLGAGRVVAAGRSQEALDTLVRRLGPRVRPAPMTGDEEKDRRLIGEVAGGPVDCVLDFLPRQASASQVRAAMLTVRPGGRIVLMGGVGRQGTDDLAVPYPWLMRNDITLRGKWMYGRDAVPSMVQMTRTGMVDLGAFGLTEFALDDANAAVAHAAATAGPLRLPCSARTSSRASASRGVPRPPHGCRRGG